MCLKDSPVLLFMLLSAVSCGKGLDVNNKAKSSSQDSGVKIIRISTTTHDGNFGASAAAAIANADTFCASEVAGYKAMLVNSVRYADTGSGSADWVLKPNTQYVTEDGVTVIGTTNASATFDADMSSIIFENSIGSTGGVVAWTGLDSVWNTDWNCTDWTTAAGNGMTGDTASISTNAIAENSLSCATSYHLYCVQQ